MKKKILVVVGLIALLLGGVTFIFYPKQSKASFVQQIYQDNKTDVDKGVEELMKSNHIKAMEDTKKVESMRELLNLYQKNKKIKNLYYDTSSMTFTFQYENGILGGVMLKDFDPMLN